MEETMAPVQNQVASHPKAVAKIVDQVREVAVLPQVVMRIVEMTGSSDAAVSEFERVIAVDPGFSVKVLTLANSAYIALPRRVLSIKDAVMFLGAKGVRQLAIAAGVFDMFVGKTDAESLRRRAWWRHSLDTAHCSRWLATTLNAVDPDVAYTCGLLHYIGRTLLDRSNPKAYEKVNSLIEQGARDREAEREVFGCNHIQVGEAVAAKWGLPSTLIAGLNYADPAEPSETGAKLRATVALGRGIALRAVDGTATAKEEPVPLWSLCLLGLSGSDAQTLIEGGAAAIAASRQVA